jgi:hypothetical protein
VTHFPDGAPYASGRDPDEGLVAIGWLERGFAYPRGEVSREFVEKLRLLCRDRVVNVMRGWHHCTLCEPPSGEGLPLPLEVDSPQGPFPVGHGEIRLGGEQKRFAAPHMIIHYVEDHGYRPPDEFIDAVLGGA